MTMSVRALAEDHLPQIVAACGDWEELAQYGPPYWRPRSPAELRRKIAATAGPQPGTEYTFVLATEAGELVGSARCTALTGGIASRRLAFAYGIRRTVGVDMVRLVCST